VRGWVNGELRQDGQTTDLIFDIPTLIETCSRGITLYPGDVIATGTPAGVGMGMTPPRYLKAGDAARGHDLLRARLLDGLAAHLRPAGAGPAVLLGHGLVRQHGFDTWTMDNEGYGRSDKHRDINSDISNGADDLAAGSDYVLKATGAKNLLMYGISSAR
jgi:pimeloyl-ACP methyl ester carboxylesterase